MLSSFDPAAVAAVLLPRPSDFGTSDARLYNTHAPIVAHAVNSDDILSASNFETIRDHMSCVASNTEHDADCCWTPDGSKIDGAHDGDVIDARIRHWAVGPCDQLFVRVYAERCTSCGVEIEPGFEGVFWATDDAAHGAHTDCPGPSGWHTAEFTESWIEACRILERLSDYPVFDDSDYSDREWHAFQEDLTEALDDAARQYPDDDDADADAIRAAFWQACSDGDDAGASGRYGNGQADWQAAADLYRRTRDSVFDARAREFWFAECPGQAHLYA